MFKALRKLGGADVIVLRLGLILGLTLGVVLTRVLCPVLQLFFEDSIDDAKYCGRSMA